MGRSDRDVARRLAASSLAAVALAVSACSGVHRLDRDLDAIDRLWTLRGRVSVPQWSGEPIVVAVLRTSRREGIPYEVVDFEQLRAPGAFRFIVEPRRYRLVAFLDANDDLRYQTTERLGAFRGYEEIASHTVDRSHLDIEIVGAPVDQQFPAVGRPTLQSRSILVGEVLPLSDVRFGPRIGRLGMWAPLQFMRDRGAGLWMLEPYDPARTPVVFIHGIGGYPQEFRPIIERLDRTRFQAWVVQYPSGWALGDSAEYFHRGLEEIHTMHRFERMCLVAHSMGGVVARAMLNQHAAHSGESFIRGFVTIAAPLGGHPAAAQGVRVSPFVVPAWRDLVPDSAFLRGLYAHRLPADMRYALFLTTRDGVVPLASQARREAREEAAVVRRFASSHGGVLHESAMIDELQRELDRCRGDR